MNKKKLVPGLNVRIRWTINPRTRIHENNIRKNKKKCRQACKKVLQDGFTEYTHDGLN